MSAGIYKFENKINNKIYIGQAIDLAERYRKHKSYYKNESNNKDLYVDMRLYGFDNFDYEIIEIIEPENISMLDELECYYINYYNSMKPNGYNMVPGGTNGAGLAKGKPVLQYDLDGNFITQFCSASEAARQTGIDNSSICSCCNQQITHTKHFQWKYADDEREIIPIEAIINERPVYQYTLSGKLIATYSSLQEASDITNIHKPTLCNACKGKYKTAGGFVWSYKKITSTDIKKPITQKKIVLQYTFDGQFIAEYESCMEAARKTGVACGGINAVCNNKRKSAGNFIWKYKE